MNAVGRLGGYISRGVYTVSGPFHPFGGCVDIIVVEQQDGSFKSSPWYVRFGKFQGVLKTREKVVTISVNGSEADFHMFLDHKGEAYFLREVDSIGDEDLVVLNAYSSSGDDDGPPIAVARSNSRRERILGLVFGRGSSSSRIESDVERTDSIERAEFAANLMEVKWSTNFDPDAALIDRVDSSTEVLPKVVSNGDEVRSFVYCESSECSFAINGSLTEQTSETMIVAGGESEELRVSSEVARARIEPPIEETVVEHFSEDYELGIGDKPVAELESCTRSQAGESSQDLCTVSSVDNLVLQSEVEENAKVERSLDDSESLSESFKDITSSFVLEEEEQLLFGEIDEFSTGEVQRIEDAKGSSDESDRPKSLSEKSVDEESLTENLQLSSSPIAITGARKEVMKLAESLPIMWTDIQTFEAGKVDCLSHSLDSKSKILDWALQSKSIPGSIKSDVQKDPQSVPELSDTNDAMKTEEVMDQSSASPIGDPSSATASPGGNWRLWPFSLRKSTSQKSTQLDSSDVRSSDAKIASEEVKIDSNQDKKETKAATKTVRVPCPTSQQLASLNLKEGMNTITFTFLTPMLGKQQVDARIFLWKWNTRIVISDVDGTITRSDVLGQFMPLVGVDWSHLGVAHLFSAIQENGYQMLFLSARAISQAHLTRRFLFNLKQDGKALPDGPVVISPDGLFPSLYREVIRRAPHEFKIACLEDIRSLFPPDCNPFYAGFGNRDTDEVSYLKVGIPKGKIFIINPKGEVAVNRRVDTRSYKSIHTLVHGMFPPASSSEQQEDFNSWNFWKLPPLLIED